MTSWGSGSLLAVSPYWFVSSCSGGRIRIPTSQQTLCFTLISNSRGLRLLAHQKIADVRAALRENQDIESVSETVELQTMRTTVGDTDQGKAIQDEITDLYNLLLAYQNGVMKPQE